jgi:hypothetical protein
MNKVRKKDSENIQQFLLTDHHKVLLPEEKEKINILVSKFAEKIGRSHKINFIEGEVNAYYNKKNKITGFEFHFHVNFREENKLSAMVEDKVLWNAVKKSMQKVQHQLKRKEHR